MKVKKIGASFFTIMMGTVILAGLTFAGEGTEKTAEEALALLKEGNARFVAMKMEHPEETAARREETAARREETAVNGQGPFAIVLGCSDSRVPVEAIFDRGIGDIFTVRVAGNVAIDSSVIGSLEYGAGHLRVPLLVILGHTQCGAVAAAVSGAKLEGGLVEVQKAIEPSVKEVKMQYPDLKETALTNEAVKQNVFQVERDLRAYSPQIQAMVAQGSLKIALAAYDLRTGKVEWLEEI